ncbi:hypothetical protein RRG08_015737 [Elysia crispata]|uniref:Uncharacterized protein n=1 Tax=Elysia crispata TaxID=231223 RepID=A0AAE0YSY5_9GAST|nr:hypothetical protein RRG08_015737 [Elysia crispata]
MIHRSSSRALSPPEQQTVYHFPSLQLLHQYHGLDLTGSLNSPDPLTSLPDPSHVSSRAAGASSPRILINMDFYAAYKDDSNPLAYFARGVMTGRQGDNLASWWRTLTPRIISARGVMTGR